MALSRPLISVNYPCHLVLLLRLCTKRKWVQIKITTTTITLFIMSPYLASALYVSSCLLSPSTLWGRWYFCCCCYYSHPHSVDKLRHEVIGSNPALSDCVSSVARKLTPVGLLCVTAINRTPTSNNKLKTFCKLSVTLTNT